MHDIGRMEETARWVLEAGGRIWHPDFGRLKLTDGRLVFASGMPLRALLRDDRKEDESDTAAS